MPGPDGGLGKKGEEKVQLWLDRPDEGYSFDRIPDQMNGFKGSSNICDFICYKYPEMYYIECKSTWEDRFDFSMLTEKQHDGLLEKSRISHVHGWVIVLFASYKRAFVIDIRDIKRMEDSGKKSINIHKIDSAQIPISCKEITTIPNNRKTYLDYFGDISDYIPEYKGG